MSKRVALVAASLLLVSLDSLAVTGPRIILGAGLSSCKEYTEYSKSPGYKARASNIETWVYGYISGLNTTVLKDDILKNSSDALINGALKLYCEENPADNMSDAAFKVAMHLADRADRAAATAKSKSK